jgi:outer membrane protein OmpA-like peptidoglycan-associated protein
MKKLLRVISFLLILKNMQAQQNLTLYSMQAIPQAMYVNPGVMPLTKINIGLPGISSNYLNFSNSGFAMHDLFKADANGGLLIDANSFLGKLKPTNRINLNVHTDLLSFGFKVKQNYFSFNLTERVDVRMSYTKDLFSLLVNGNGVDANLNRNMLLNVGLDATHYREWGFNYTREVIKDKLTLGGRVKILSGMENVNTEKSSATLNTNSQYYALTATANIQANTSGVDDNSQKNMASILGFNPSRKNRGLGIDLGGSYKLNKKFSFTASLIDLGFITWKDYTTNYVSQNPGASVSYKGIDIGKAFSDSANLGKSLSNLGDSAQKTLGINTQHTTYHTMLATQLYLGGNYWLNEKNNVGLVLNGQYANKHISPAMSLSFNNKVGRWFSASLSYSMMNRSYDNVGLGLSFTGPVQFYVVSDNILSFLILDKYKSDNSSFVVPAYSKNLNLRFGINITLGKIPKDKDKDGVIDKLDACPDVAGLAALKGCPDRDGDGIPDKDDACPDVPGIAALKGCPDRDGDGITDADDKCPDQYGPAEFNGCPDRDGDKIIDKDDECPDQFGLAEFMGCPDTDGDGTPDKYDACPTAAGPKENKGCPDRDGDKVLDMDDACPDVAGPVENKGCPWPDRDGDGVPDKDDDCPDTPGLIVLKGCPPIKQEERKILEKAFSSLEFMSGKEIIKKASYPSLKQLALLMQEHAADWTLKLSGYTDNQGSAEKNMLLSEKRAKAVKKYLQSQGAPADKILTEWFGQTQPVADNATEAGRQKNRRVEMKVVFK